MKRVSFILAAIGLFFSSYGQYFEGYVHYQISIVNVKDVPQEQINMLYSLHGKDVRWFFKGGQYKKELSSELLEEVLYTPASNLLHEYTRKGKTYNKRSASKDPGTLEVLPFVPDKFEILGHECKRTDLKGSDFTIEISYSGKFKLDSKLYKNHKADYLDEIFRKTKSVPLKLVYRYKDVTVIYRAVELKREPLGTGVFSFKKNSEALQEGVKNELIFVEAKPESQSFSIKVPNWMRKTTELDEDLTVEIQYQDKEKPLFIKVVSTPVSEVRERGESFREYVESVERNLKMNIESPSLREITAAPIEGMEVRYYELTGDLNDEVSLYYQIGIIEGKKSFYQILVWTEIDSKGPLVPHMKRMIRSLREH